MSSSLDDFKNKQREAELEELRKSKNVTTKNNTRPQQVQRSWSKSQPDPPTLEVSTEWNPLSTLTTAANEDKTHPNVILQRNDHENQKMKQRHEIQTHPNQNIALESSLIRQRSHNLEEEEEEEQQQQQQQQPQLDDNKDGEEEDEEERNRTLIPSLSEEDRNRLLMFKATLESQGTSHIVVNLQDHFMKQKGFKKNDREKAIEAASILHSYVGTIFDRSKRSVAYSATDKALYLSVDAKVKDALDRVAFLMRKTHGTSNGVQKDTHYDRMNVSMRKSVYVLVVHDTRGILLLLLESNPENHSKNVSLTSTSSHNRHEPQKDGTRNMNHRSTTYQLPGGSIQEIEFVAASKVSGHDTRLQWLIAAKIAAVRLLHSSTGIQIQNQWTRLQPISLRSSSSSSSCPTTNNDSSNIKDQGNASTTTCVGDTCDELNCEIQGCLFFNLFINDEDLIFKNGILKEYWKQSSMKIVFEKNPSDVIEKVRSYGDGICHDALQMAIHRNDLIRYYDTLDKQAVDLITPPKPERKSIFSCFAPCFG